MADDLRLEFTDEPTADDLGAVDAGLHLYNIGAADLGAVQTMACFARTDAGAVVGGLRARQWGAAVEVQQLWVDEPYRRNGIAKRLMDLLEQAVVARCAAVIYLDTFSFQAPGFYRRCGFDTAARIDGFPDGIGKFLMVKYVSRGPAG